MSSKVDHLVEVRGVYDGWSIAVTAEPYTYVNRWAVRDNPLVAKPGYERRFRLTEEYIQRSGVNRGRLDNLDWDDLS